MTEVPDHDSEILHRILSSTEALLLDFDGPICSVFAGFPAHAVADQLRSILAEGGHCNLPRKVANSDDPFDVLIFAGTLGEREARYVEAAFRAHEIEAVSSATPTPNTHNLVHNWKLSGRPLAIVSNNSYEAVHSYLSIHRLNKAVDIICARTNFDTSQLKPDPYLVRLALNKLGVSPTKATMIGDSASDMLAASAAKVTPVGFANKPEKLVKLKQAGARTVITQMPGDVS